LIRTDDALDVFGVHAVGGITGALLTGVFNAPSLGGPGLPADWFSMKPGYPGILDQFNHQAKGVGITFIWTAVAAFIAFKIADLIVGLRVPEDEEREGLDTSSHGESRTSIDISDGDAARRAEISRLVSSGRYRAARLGGGSRERQRPGIAGLCLSGPRLTLFSVLRVARRVKSHFRQRFMRALWASNSAGGASFPESVVFPRYLSC